MALRNRCLSTHALPNTCSHQWAPHGDIFFLLVVELGLHVSPRSGARRHCAKIHSAPPQTTVRCVVSTNEQVTVRFCDCQTFDRLKPEHVKVTLYILVRFRRQLFDATPALTMRSTSPTKFRPQSRKMLAATFEYLFRRMSCTWINSVRRVPACVVQPHFQHRRPPM
jgi:hypothetical protein